MNLSALFGSLFGGDSEDDETYYPGQRFQDRDPVIFRGEKYVIHSCRNVKIDKIKRKSFEKLSANGDQFAYSIYQPPKDMFEESKMLHDIPQRLLKPAEREFIEAGFEGCGNDLEGMFDDIYTKLNERAKLKEQLDKENQDNEGAI